MHRNSSPEGSLRHRLSWCPYFADPEGEDVEDQLIIALAHGSTVRSLSPSLRLLWGSMILACCAGGSAELE